jgi:hypothetical protein
MTLRSEVFAAIDRERTYQAGNYPDREAGQNPLTVGGELSLLHEYLESVSQRRDQDALEYVCTLAAIAVRCMETHGCIMRGAHPDRFPLGPLSRHIVYAYIGAERDYQDSLPPSRTDGQPRSIGDYFTMLRYYMRQADEAWTVNPGNGPALDVIRKIAGICVHCMEDHGVCTA